MGLRGLLLLAIVLVTDAQQMNDICSYGSVSELRSNYYVGVTQSTRWTSSGRCTCVVSSSNSNPSYVEVETALLIQKDSDYYSEMDRDDWSTKCAPVMLWEASDTQYYVCPAKETDQYATRKDMVHKSTRKIDRNTPMTFHIYNPKGQYISNYVKVTGANNLRISCSPATRMYTFDFCPCTGAGGQSGTVEQLKMDKGLAIGLPVALVIIIVIIIIIAVVCWKKKKDAYDTKENRDENSTKDNKAFQGSQQEMQATRPPRPKPTQTGPRVEYAPDPNRNLAKEPHHGSLETGLARNGTDPQYLGKSQSLEDVNQQQQNYPPLAGQGSQTSLDRPMPPTQHTGPYQTNFV